ncbi:MAG: tetratricopeptide repeat protein, partial [Rubrivivax sp.]
PEARPAIRGGRAGAVMLALALPVLAVGLYAQLGNRAALDPLAAPAPAAPPSAADVEAMVERLAQRMRERPDDPEGWLMLGRSYAVMGRFEPARDAYAQAIKRLPDDAALLADYADVLAMTLEGRVAGEPERLVLRALQLDPDNLKALALAGTAALERGDAAAAVPLWEHARRVAPPDSPIAAGLDESVREARAAAGLAQSSTAGDSAASAHTTGTATAATPAAVGTSALTVRVTLAPALAATAQPDDTLYVFVRAADGPRMPLAIARRRASDLPLTLTLDDAMAMSPQLRLSAFDRVVVGARVSRSGQALPQPGDLEGEAPPRSTPAGEPPATVAVEISRVRR